MDFSRSKSEKDFMKEKITHAFLTMVLFLILALSLLLFFVQHTFIGGNLYNEIICANELIEDTMPSPRYIDDSYTDMLAYINQTDQGSRDRLYAAIQNYESEYGEQYTYWQENLPDGDLNKYLEESYESACSFYSIFFDQVVPAAKSFNMTALKNARSDLLQAYNSHKNTIDESVILAQQWQQEVLDKSKEWKYYAEISSVLLFLAIVGLGMCFGRKIQQLEKSLLKYGLSRRTDRTSKPKAVFGKDGKADYRFKKTKVYNRIF